MWIYFGFALLGLLAGAVGGFAGIGGGILIIPALVLLFGYDQLRAQAMSLAVLILPIQIISFMQYWKNPAARPDLLIAGLIALGSIAGHFAGGRLANILDPVMVRKSFSALIFAASIYLFFKK